MAIYNQGDKLCNNSIEFIGGSFQELLFAVYDEQSGDPVNLNTFKKITMIVYPYGDTANPVNSIDGFVQADDSKVVVFEITTDKTKDLIGLYQYQIKILKFDDNEFRPIYGNINIIPRSSTL